MQNKNKKDWCSWFPEYWFGTYIGDCCKRHDKDCKAKAFFKCLKETAGYLCAVLVSGGGTIGCIVKYDILRMKFKHVPEGCENCKDKDEHTCLFCENENSKQV